MRASLAALALLLGGCYDVAALLGRHRPPFEADTADLSPPDTGGLDLAMSDAADLAVPVDLTVAPPFDGGGPDVMDATTDDAGGATDLSAPVDLAAAPDLPARGDGGAGPDLLPPPDLTPPGSVFTQALFAPAVDVRVGDVNGDGAADVVASMATAGTVVSLLGDGKGGFIPSGQSALPGPPGRLAPLGDFDHDGRLDLATINETNHAVYVAYSHGDGTFVGGQTYALASAPSAIEAADLDGDTFIDLVVTSAAGGTITVLMGAPGQKFSVQKAMSAGKSPTQLALGDLDGDGQLDVVASDFGPGAGNTGFLLCPGNGDGTFHSPTKVKGSLSVALALADLDADGKLDIVYTDATMAVVGALRNRGKLSFDAAVNSAAASIAPGALVVADLDLDGKLEAAVADRLASSVQAFHGTGKVTLTQSSIYPVGLTPVAVRAGQLDGASGIDLVTANAGASSLTLVFAPL